MTLLWYIHALERITLLSEKVAHLQLQANCKLTSPREPISLSMHDNFPQCTEHPLCCDFGAEFELEAFNLRSNHAHSLDEWHELLIKIPDDFPLACGKRLRQIVYDALDDTDPKQYPLREWLDFLNKTRLRHGAQLTALVSEKAEGAVETEQEEYDFKRVVRSLGLALPTKSILA